MQNASADTLTQEIIRYLHSINYTNPENRDHEYKIVLGLVDGVVLRGRIISPDQFMSENSWRNGGHWPDPEDEDFAYPIANDDPTNYVHLTNVQYLSGRGWVDGSTARVSINAVMFAGEKF